MPFEKGKSGNPGGRPKENQEVKELARTHTVEAVERLAHWMRSDLPGPSVKASAVLLERAWGKAEQTVTIDDKREATDWTRDELVAFLDDAKAGGERAAKAGRGDGKSNLVH